MTKKCGSKAENKSGRNKQNSGAIAAPDSSAGLRKDIGRRRAIHAGELANYLKVSECTLGRRRKNGTGPAFMQRGRRIFYHWSDVEVWLNRLKRTSTRD